MKQTQSKKQLNKATGTLGENLACEYLQQRGFVILDTNYWKKYGEIDVIARKSEMVYFVEVKTVSYETKVALEQAVTHETWRPEEQVHQFKIHQIEKALETWIYENDYKGDWQISVLGIRVVPRETFCTVNFIENINS